MLSEVAYPVLFCNVQLVTCLIIEKQCFLCFSVRELSQIILTHCECDECESSRTIGQFLHANGLVNATFYKARSKKR